MRLTDEQYRRMVEHGGAVWLRIQRGCESVGGDIILFQDPETRSTCALYASALTEVADIEAALRRKREQLEEVAK